MGRRAFTPTQTGPDMAIGVLADCLMRDYNNSFFSKGPNCGISGANKGPRCLHSKLPLHRKIVSFFCKYNIRPQQCMRICVCLCLFFFSLSLMWIPICKIYSSLRLFRIPIAAPMVMNLQGRIPPNRSDDWAHSTRSTCLPMPKSSSLLILVSSFGVNVCL